MSDVLMQNLIWMQQQYAETYEGDTGYYVIISLYLKTYRNTLPLLL